MEEIKLRFARKTFRVFNSKYQFSFYLLDSLIKFLLLFLVLFIGLSNLMISGYGVELSRFFLLYCFAVVLWTLMLARIVLLQKRVWGRTIFDSLIMGLLTSVLISILFSEDKIVGMFGASRLWSLSLISILAFGILYFQTTIFFKYIRGVKWLFGALVASVLVSSVYFITKVLYDRYFPSNDFIIYIVYSLPLIIFSMTLFKKKYIKMFSFFSVLAVLVLTSFYYESIEGVFFILGFSLLLLFLFFYFYVWMKNVKEVFEGLKAIINFLTRKIKYSDLVSANKRQLALVLLLFFSALWIIIFASLNIGYFNENIKVLLSDNFRNDIKQIDTARLWILGKGDFSFSSSQFDAVNVLLNYGLLGSLWFLLLFIYVIYKQLRLLIHFLGKVSWKNALLMISILLTTLSLLIHLFLARFTPLLYILLVFVMSITAIVSDLLFTKDKYSLPDSVFKYKRRIVFFKIFLLLILLFIAVYILKGLYNGLEDDIFLG